MVQAIEAERAKWAGEQRKQGKGKGGDKASKAEAERARAREIAEAEEAVARCTLLTSPPHCTGDHYLSRIRDDESLFQYTSCSQLASFSGGKMGQRQHSCRE